jgi:branched-chain amino acid transport system permease protein
MGIVGALFLLAAIVSIAIRFAQGPKDVLQIVTTGLANGSMYALIALGYTMVYGIIELINFAHADVVMLTAVFGATMIGTWFGQAGASTAAFLLLMLTLVATMAFGAGLNASIEKIAYRRLRNAPKLAPLICAVGVSFILQNVGIKWNGSQPVNRPPVLTQKKLTIGAVELRYVELIAVLITIPLLLALTYLVQRTRVGKAMRATAQDRDASLLMGIDVDKVISITFAIGGALAGAAGVLFVQVNGYTRYDLGFRLGLIAFTAAVLGGVGNLLGAVIGALLIGLIQAFNDAKVLLPKNSPKWMLDFTGQRWTQTVMFTILILTIIFRPGGILGTHQQEKV